MCAVLNSWKYGLPTWKKEHILCRRRHFVRWTSEYPTATSAVCMLRVVFFHYLRHCLASGERIVSLDVHLSCFHAVCVSHISLDGEGNQGGHKKWKTRGILRDFCAASGKNCNKQSIFSSSFKYLCKTAVDWVNRIIRILGVATLPNKWWWSWCGMKVIITLLHRWWSLLHLLFVAITYRKVSLWLWKSLENSANFFLLLCGHPGKALYPVLSSFVL